MTATPRIRRVIIETPYAGATEANIAYARACMRDSLERGEAPMMSHLLYTQALDDTIPEERALGIAAGLGWGEVCDLWVVYTDLGISKGMKEGIARAEELGKPIEHRTLEGGL